MKSSTVFTNANIVTGTYEDCAFDSVLVIGDTIAKVGTFEECKNFAEGEVQIIDCQKHTLLPGFIDAHNHITQVGASLRAPKFNYPEVACIEDVVKVVENAVKTRSPGQWIRGWGLDYGKFPQAVPPTRFDLDKVSPQNPVAIVHYTGHYVLVNSKALELAGIDDSVQDPEGGRFLRDEQGRLNGIAQDSAQQMVIPTVVDVKHHGPDIGYVTPLDELMGDIKAACDAFLEVGLTTICDPQVTTREMVGLLHANNNGELTVRTLGMYLSNHLETQLDMGIHEQFGNDFFKIGPIKYYTDGAIVGGSAAFREPLDNRSDGYCGSLYWEDQDAFAESLYATHKNGLQFAIHTQGDRAHDLMLKAVGQCLEKLPRKDHRHRIEHSGGALTEHIKKIAEYGMIPVTQPGQLREAGKNLIDNYGEKRACRLYPLREFLDNNIPAVISSDAFVQSFNPLSTIRGAVERISDQGQDMGKDQRISLKEAIVCHTWNAAHAMFWEDKIGSIEEGKLADIVLLDRDIFKEDIKNFLDVKVMLTMVNGKIAFERK